MNLNNNISLFENTVVNLLKRKGKPVSVSDISTELKKLLPENELPPKGYFLEKVSKIKNLIKHDNIKMNMPFFSYNEENKENIEGNNLFNIKYNMDQHNFLKKYRQDFYTWLHNYKKYKASDKTTYTMWESLKKDYETCLENIKIVDTKYPKLQKITSSLRLKRLPTEIKEDNSNRTINITNNLPLKNELNFVLPTELNMKPYNSPVIQNTKSYLDINTPIIPDYKVSSLLSKDPILDLNYQVLLSNMTPQKITTPYQQSNTIPKQYLPSIIIQTIPNTIGQFQNTTMQQIPNTIGQFQNTPNNYQQSISPLSTDLAYLKEFSDKLPKFTSELNQHAVPYQPTYQQNPTDNLQNTEFLIGIAEELNKLEPNQFIFLINNLMRLKKNNLSQTL